MSQVPTLILLVQVSSKDGGIQNSKYTQSTLKVREKILPGCLHTYACKKNLRKLWYQITKCGTNYKTRHNGVIGSLDLSYMYFTWKQKIRKHHILDKYL